MSPGPRGTSIIEIRSSRCARPVAESRARNYQRPDIFADRAAPLTVDSARGGRGGGGGIRHSDGLQPRPDAAHDARAPANVPPPDVT